MEPFDRANVSFRRAMRRGAARLLILKVLTEGPHHGYTIARRISELFRGEYDPSPGVIYPTLQALEDVGQVRSARSEGRVVYAITPAGRAELARHRTDLALVLRGAGVPGHDPARPIARAADRLRRVLLFYLPEMSTAQRVRVARMLDAARVGISRLMEGSA